MVKVHQIEQYILSEPKWTSWEKSLLKANHPKARLEFAILHIDKTQLFWENVLWTNETIMDVFTKVHELCIQRPKLIHTDKNILWNMEEAQFWSGAAFLHLSVGSGYDEMLRLSRHFGQKSTTLSENLVSVAGHGPSNRTTAQTQLQTPKND